jgi:transglutaminase-like putative cysteine protease
MPRRSLAALLLASSALFAFAQSVAAQPAPFPNERHFKFHYSFTVKNVNPGERVRVWIPLAHSDTYQTVNVTAKSGDLPLKQVAQPEYGNDVLYAETPKADRPEYKFSVDYDVVRKEHIVLVNGKPVRDAAAPKAPRLDLTRFLGPDRLVPVTGLPAQLAEQETKGATTPLEKAKDIYEYVFRTMKYDKTGTGWGHGDTLWACDSKHGNCTDFHSVFIGMMRADDIPARFDIGFPVPDNEDRGNIAGYHCWAEFFARNIGWIPVDISDAWNSKEKKDYLFGSVDANRIQFSTGRDITLSPHQDGPPLNYFVYPYVEIDGKSYDGISRQFSFVAITGEQKTADSRPAPAPAM